MEKPETKKAGATREAAEARQAEYMPGRWAVIKKMDDEFDRDVREQVIDIKQMAPGHRPDLYDLEDKDNENAKNYSVEQVPEGVIIGMRRGGKFESTAGFGWRDVEDKAAKGNPVGSGATRLADVGQR